VQVDEHFGQMAWKVWSLVTVPLLHFFASLVVATPQGKKTKDSIAVHVA
jgi:hypothetical protein